MSYNAWLAQRAQNPPDEGTDTPPFGFNALVDNLSD
jgi:hypothetical protein